MSKEMRTLIDTFKTFLIKESKKITNNIVQIETDINNDVLNYYYKKYPNKWVLYNKELGYIWIKDKPNLFYRDLPNNVYHISKNPNLDKTGIKTSSETETPFGYFNFSFFYLNVEDANYGSIPHIEGETYLYEVDTDIPNLDWYEGFNESLDGEENITTNSFIEPKYVKKIK